MTRINLIPPKELSDQHLFAEFREIKMVPKSLNRSIISARRKWGEAWSEMLFSRIPLEFTLNTGHVTFFYDKGLYLYNRYEQLKKELDKRGVNYNKQAELDPDGIMFNGPWFNDYKPTVKALRIVQERIQNKLLEKPHWYKYYGKPFFK